MTIFMKYNTLFIIFEKVEKIEIVVCCKLLVALYWLNEIQIFFLICFLQDQTIRLIYSYHELDPTSETSPPYHGAEHRGTKSVSLLSSSLPSPVFQQDDLKIYEFRTRNVSNRKTCLKRSLIKKTKNWFSRPFIA